MHPAAKLVALAAHSQEEEIGDNTNLVVVVAGTLLESAEDLLRTGLHTADIIAGYSRASKAALEHLESLSCHTVTDLRDQKAVALALKGAIGAKQAEDLALLDGKRDVVHGPGGAKAFDKLGNSYCRVHPILLKEWDADFQDLQDRDVRYRAIIFYEPRMLSN